MAYSYTQLKQFALNAGFTGKSADTAAAIALAESSGNPNAINYNDPQGSYGLLQINQKAHPGTSTTALDPQGSFNLAYNISGGGTNFRPWSTYTSGAYQQYLSGSDTTGLSIDPSLNPGLGTDPSLDHSPGATGTPSGTPGSDPTAGGTIDPLTGAPSGDTIGKGTINLPGAIGGGISSIVGAAESWISTGLIGLLAIVLVLIGLFWLVVGNPGKIVKEYAFAKAGA